MNIRKGKRDWINIVTELNEKLNGRESQILNRIGIETKVYNI